MALDTNVFSKLHTFQDYAKLEEEFQARKALQQAQMDYYSARSDNVLKGGNTPAALQINDEIERRIKAGDFEGAQRIADAAKLYDKGLQVYSNQQQINPMLPKLVQAESGGDPNALSPKGAAGAFQIMPSTAADPGFGVQPLQGWDGKDPRTATLEEQSRFANDYLNAMQSRNGGDPRLAAASYNAGPAAVDKVIAGLPAETRAYVPKVTGKVTSRPGYSEELGNREAIKAGMKSRAEYNVKQTEEPKLEYNKKVAEKDAALIGKNQDAMAGLDNMAYSIKQARDLLPKVSMTGPIFGRIGAAAEDPNYRNLQGAINSVVLQAKDLYNLGSGQGFTDADRNFLQETIAGKYAKAETIGLGLDRMEQALAHRQEFLNKQSQNIAYKYTGDKVESQGVADIPEPPKLGQTMQGTDGVYIFKGGNPADPKSWGKK